MDRDQLMAEIKKMLQEELKNYSRQLTNKVTDNISDEHKAQAVELKNEATEFVKENPWVAVGAAAIVGFVIARFLYKEND